MDVLGRYLTIGIHISVQSYYHINDTDVKVFIAFLTMFMFYLDDAYPRGDVDILARVPTFTKHFISSEEQPCKILNGFSDLLNEAFRIVDKVAAGLIVFSALKFITELILEQSKDESAHTVEEYAMFLRELGGLAEGYSLHIFPRELPYAVYIWALPCMRDLLTLVMTFSQARSEPKIMVLHDLVGKYIKEYETVLHILQPHADAHYAFKEFARGYLAFHLDSKIPSRLGALVLSLEPYWIG
ncbi:terpenoid synthase [Guyanagaster necrorhizus]|uniref:Terpenoid synthase n=1 Tax=Guyanagaster necrorhizus TaxID=856835 RepID=A0A9P8AMW3_9AGAR|nr:terpenoid synthase [Guyanagaster necrorhizus MCA 3950]KAG7440257.1 terpenoid synthase [Guyanagaster necrorhizus MCA 3950]